MSFVFSLYFPNGKAGRPSDWYNLLLTTPSFKWDVKWRSRVNCLSGAKTLSFPKWGLLSCHFIVSSWIICWNWCSPWFIHEADISLHGFTVYCLQLTRRTSLNFCKRRMFYVTFYDFCWGHHWSAESVHITFRDMYIFTDRENARLPQWLLPVKISTDFYPLR